MSYPFRSLTRHVTLAALFIGLSTGLPAKSSLHDIKVQTITEEATTLAAYKGDVMLIVNVASRCGLTPQYEQLEAVYKKYHSDGLVVLGFPCNQFAGQEPGTNEEIAEFCKLNYGVTFPLFDKIEVNGEGRHPLYTALAGEDSPFPGKISWNFTKFLVGRDGTILHRFEPRTTVDSAEVITAIESALASSAG